MIPSGSRKGKKERAVSPAKSDWIPRVPAAALVGGLLASWMASHSGQRDLAFGLGWGSLLNVLNFYSLKILTEKVLIRGEVEGRKLFWFWVGIRWLGLGLACWFFISRSPLCLAGAVASYIWYLVFLGFAGWQNARHGT